MTTINTVSGLESSPRRSLCISLAKADRRKVQRSLCGLIAAFVLGISIDQSVSAQVKQQENTQPTKATAPTDVPSAAEILKKSREIYATCKSYQDDGEVVTVFGRPNAFTSTKPFSTLFVRPDLFRFEFRDNMMGHNSKYVVWNDGKIIRSWWSIRPETTTFADMNMALGGPTGVSGGSAVMIPGLLMPQLMWGGLLRHVKDERFIAVEKIDDHSCFKVEAVVNASAATSSSYQLWIDHETYLIRQIIESRDVPEVGVVVSTFEYKPVLNPELSRDQFHFEPPKSEADQTEHSTVPAS